MPQAEKLRQDIGRTLMLESLVRADGVEYTYIRIKDPRAGVAIDDVSTYHALHYTFSPTPEYCTAAVLWTSPHSAFDPRTQAYAEEFLGTGEIVQKTSKITDDHTSPAHLLGLDIFMPHTAVDYMKPWAFENGSTLMAAFRVALNIETMHDNLESGFLRIVPVLLTPENVLMEIQARENKLHKLNVDALEIIKRTLLLSKRCPPDFSPLNEIPRELLPTADTLYGKRRSTISGLAPFDINVEL